MGAVENPAVVATCVLVAAWAAFSAAVLRVEQQKRRTGYRRGRKPPTIHPRHQFDRYHSSDFGVGLQSDAARLRILTKLTVDRQWIRVGTLLPVWIDRNRVDQVEVVALGRRRALMFRSPDSCYAGVLLYTITPEGAMETLRAFDWPT
jgi:hypothetical protein